MTNFSTIIVANPQKANLTDELIAQVAPNCEDVKIIKDGVAAEVSGAELVQNAEVDIFEVPQAEYKLLVCDMESTIIDNEFFDDIAEQLGVSDKVKEITAKAMNDEINFEESMQARIALVEGIEKSQLLQIAKDKLKYNDGAAELIRSAKEKGIYTMLVSGGFTLFTEIVFNELGFDEHHANELLFDESDKLTGVGLPILGKEAKLEITKAKCAEKGFDLSQVAAIGDGANDLDMLQNVGLGVGYKAKPIVKEKVKNQINAGDLSSINYLL